MLRGMMSPSPFGSFCTKMEVSTRQNDVFKLVHPGRYVEVFMESITANEIMKKYPRHCITSPNDASNFSWITVPPESVLVPGEVFYLVPYFTMFRSSCYEVKRNLQQLQETSSHNHSDSEVDSSIDGRGYFSVIRNQRPRVTSSEHVEPLNVKSCLRKVDSVRKKLKLKVSFA